MSTKFQVSELLLALQKQGATHYSTHKNGSINHFYRYALVKHSNKPLLQYFSIFGEWNKSRLTKEQINSLKEISK